jgi:hypothetical protein
MGRSDLEYLSALQRDRAFVRRLAPAARIKTGLIKGDGILLDADDRCLCFKAVVIL